MKNIVIAIIIGTMSCILIGNTNEKQINSTQLEYLQVVNENQEGNTQVLEKNIFVQNK